MRRFIRAWQHGDEVAAHAPGLFLFVLWLLGRGPQPAMSARARLAQSTTLTPAKLIWELAYV